MKDELHIAFAEFARRRHYYFDAGVSERSSIHAIAQRSNPYCGDKLHLVLLENNKSKLLLNHCGTYCAMAHASAELLCECYMKLELDDFYLVCSYLLRGLQEKDSTLENKMQCLVDEHYPVSILQYVHKRMISRVRRTCFLLAWQAAEQISLKRKSKKYVYHSNDTTRRKPLE